MLMSVQAKLNRGFAQANIGYCNECSVWFCKRNLSNGEQLLEIFLPCRLKSDSLNSSGVDEKEEYSFRVFPSSSSLKTFTSAL